MQEQSEATSREILTALHTLERRLSRVEEEHNPMPILSDLKNLVQQVDNKINALPTTVQVTSLQGAINSAIAKNDEHFLQFKDQMSQLPEIAHIKESIAQMRTVVNQLTPASDTSALQVKLGEFSNQASGHFQHLSTVVEPISAMQQDVVRQGKALSDLVSEVSAVRSTLSELGLRINNVTHAASSLSLASATYSKQLRASNSTSTISSGVRHEAHSLSSSGPSPAPSPLPLHPSLPSQSSSSRPSFSSSPTSASLSSPPSQSPSAASSSSSPNNHAVPARLPPAHQKHSSSTSAAAWHAARKPIPSRLSKKEKTASAAVSANGGMPH